MKSCVVRGLQVVVLSFEFHQNRLSGFGAMGVEICPSLLTWPLAYTTACTTVQAVISSIRNSDSRCWASEMPLKTYWLTSASTEIFEILETMSLRAHWNRRLQNSAFRPHGELFRPSDKENWATERTSVALWNRHDCKNFNDVLHISSNIGIQLHKSGNKWQRVLYGRFHILCATPCRK